MRASKTPLEDETFAKLPLQPGDNVARLVGRACKEFPRWGVDAGQVKLFLVASPDGHNEPSAIAIKDALLLEPLSPFDTLADAGIVSGSWLLARVPPPPAAAPGASRHEGRRILDSLPHSRPPPLVPALLQQVVVRVQI